MGTWASEAPAGRLRVKVQESWRSGLVVGRPAPAEEATRVVPEHVTLPEVDVAAPAVLTLAAPTVPDLTALVPQNRPAPVTLISVTVVTARQPEPAASSNVTVTALAVPVMSATPATPALPATPELASSSMSRSKVDTAVLTAEMASELMRPLLEEVSTKLLSPVLDRMDWQSTEISDALWVTSCRSHSPAHCRRQNHSRHSSSSGHKSSKWDQASSSDDRHGKK